MSKTVKLTEIKKGETFKTGDIEFIKFSDENDETVVVAKDILFRSCFGNNNDLRSSDILKKLNDEFLPKLAEVIGEENIVEFETDLTTLDGLKPYDVMKSKVSVPTFDFYRDNVEIFDKHKLDKYWWLATPESAKPHDDPSWVVCVAPSGCINFNCYCNGHLGVRPFCILKSDIFVSCEE